MFLPDSHCECTAGHVRNADDAACTTQLCADGRAFCMHGGTCLGTGDGCTCTDGVTGDNCENGEFAALFLDNANTQGMF